MACSRHGRNHLGAWDLWGRGQFVDTRLLLLLLCEAACVGSVGGLCGQCGHTPVVRGGRGCLRCGEGGR